MLTESKPVLSDGTKIADLINLETREVSMRLLSDHEVYKIEMERIFGKTKAIHETKLERFWSVFERSADLPAWERLLGVSL